MIRPIYTYGSPILREETVELPAVTGGVDELISDMIETMHGAGGIGLAAPQVGETHRLFVIDITPLLEGDDGAELARQVPEVLLQGPYVFINPELTDVSSSQSTYEEGCLSIPDVREDVPRPDHVRLRYRDRDFREHEMEATGMLARVIQHEYDHLDGVLFIDKLSPFRRRLIRRRLREMSAGKVEADYPTMLQTPS